MSPTMVQHARQSLALPEHSAIAPYVEFHVASVEEDLLAATGARVGFDWLMSMNVMHWVHPLFYVTQQQAMAATQKSGQLTLTPCAISDCKLLCWPCCGSSANGRGSASWRASGALLSWRRYSSACRGKWRHLSPMACAKLCLTRVIMCDR